MTDGLRIEPRAAKLEDIAMSLRTLPIPELPEAWPYESRPVLPPLNFREDVTLPGLGDGWTLLAPEECQIPSSAESLPEAFGRGGVARAGDVILRPYRRGGLMRSINSRCYATPRRFHRELLIHRALWQAGFPTVPPIGCAQRRLGSGYEGVFLTQFVRGVPWPRAWNAHPSILPRLAEALRALDAWGLHAPDLNATNVFVPEMGGLICLDWDKAVFTGRAGFLLAKYRQRLRRSLDKLGAPREIVDSFEKAMVLGPG